MIIGVGTDLTDINRIQSVLDEHGKRFINRCFTLVEKDKCEVEDALVRSANYAKRWSAKEACAKALGTGIADGVFLKDIGVVNKTSGQPEIILTGEALKVLERMIPDGMSAKIHLSLSDEPPLTQAFVVISAV